MHQNPDLSRGGCRFPASYLTIPIDELRNVRQVYLPVIVLGEYRYGISLSKYRRNHEEWLDSVLADFAVLPVLEPTTKYYSLICKKLEVAATPLPTNDLWVSALALEHQLPVITRDKYFTNVDGLEGIAY